MLMGILFLGLVFIVSLITTFLINTPTKKLLAWFQSLSPKADPNSHVSTNPITTKASPKKMKSSSSSSSTQNKGELKGVFATFDKNNDGFITKGELRESLKNIGIFMGEKEVSDLVEKVDSNGDGLIDLDEFCEVFESMLSRDHEVIRGHEDQEEDHEGGEEDLKEAFDVFDGDKDGLISVEELGLVLSSLGLKEGKRLESCKEMIKKVDMDGDGMVNFDEFKRMMKAGGRLVQVS